MAEERVQRRVAALLAGGATRDLRKTGIHPGPDQ